MITSVDTLARSPSKPNAEKLQQIYWQRNLTVGEKKWHMQRFLRVSGMGHIASFKDGPFQKRGEHNLHDAIVNSDPHPLVFVLHHFSPVFIHFWCTKSWRPVKKNLQNLFFYLFFDVFVSISGCIFNVSRMYPYGFFPFHRVLVYKISLFRQ